MKSIKAKILAHLIANPGWHKGVELQNHARDWNSSGASVSKRLREMCGGHKDYPVAVIEKRRVGKYEEYRYIQPQKVTVIVPQDNKLFNLPVKKNYA